MTPEDLDEGQGDSVESVLKKFGVKSVDELDGIAEKHRSRKFFDIRQDDKLEKLAAKVSELESELATKRAEEEFGSGLSPESKMLARELAALKDQQASMMAKFVRTKEDDELEHYYDGITEEYPELRKIADPMRRIEAYRRIARSLKAEAETGANSGKRRTSDASHAALAGGGAPVSTRSGPEDEGVILEKFKTELGRAKTKRDKEAVYDKYRAKYPGIV